MFCVWLFAMFLSGLPLSGNDYFKDFYSRTGVCLALYISPEKENGWEYSAFIFLGTQPLNKMLEITLELQLFVSLSVLNFLSFSIIAAGYIWMYGVAKTTRLAVGRHAESRRAELAMARRMTLIVATDAACWVPIIFLAVLSLSGVELPKEVSMVLRESA